MVYLRNPFLFGFDTYHSLLLQIFGSLCKVLFIRKILSQFTVLLILSSYKIKDVMILLWCGIYSHAFLVASNWCYRHLNWWWCSILWFAFFYLVAWFMWLSFMFLELKYNFPVHRVIEFLGLVIMYLWLVEFVTTNVAIATIA